MCWISRWPSPIQYVQLHVLLALGTIWILVLLLVIGRKKAMGVTIFLAAVFFNLLFICSSKWVAHNVKIYIHAFICILAWKFIVWQIYIYIYIHTDIYTVNLYQEIGRVMGFTYIIHLLWCHYCCNTSEISHLDFALFSVHAHIILMIIMFHIELCWPSFYLAFVDVPQGSFCPLVCIHLRSVSWC